MLYFDFLVGFLACLLNIYLHCHRSQGSLLMQTILIICSDAVRRAKLHGLLSPNFKAFAKKHKNSDYVEKKIIKENNVIVLESENNEKSVQKNNIRYIWVGPGVLRPSIETVQKKSHTFQLDK